MPKLTKAQKRVLRQVSERNGRFSVWSLGTSTCEALRKRGLVEGDRPFRGGRWGGVTIVRITPAGRAAISSTETSDG